MPRTLNFFSKLRSKLAPQTPAKPPSTPTTALLPRHHRDHGRFAPGDRVFAIHGFKARLLPPLSSDAEIQTDYGVLRHNDIIGQPLERAKVTSSKGKIATIAYPTLDEYISRSQRLVQPIYAPYASTIVDLLDIHVGPPGLTSQRVEVLDAGTGHGSLALHLARSIAAANPPPPDLPKPTSRRRPAEPESASAQVQAKIVDAWAKYRDNCNAIVHSVESVKANTVHAEKTIRGFRQGLYWPYIRFHTAGVEEWARKEHASRGSFLSHAALDLPGVHEVISAVCEALTVDGKLSVFAPSITQIAECQRVILEKNLPLHFVKVVELGEGISTGRPWDLRFVTPRARERAQAGPVASTSDAENPDENVTSNTVEDSASLQTDHTSTGKVLICRPKVGDRIVGGGFVGLFRKTSTNGSETPGFEQNVKSKGNDPNQPGTMTVATTSSAPVGIPMPDVRHEADSKETFTADSVPDQMSHSLSALTPVEADDSVPLLSLKELLDAAFDLDGKSFVYVAMQFVGRRPKPRRQLPIYLKAIGRRMQGRLYSLEPLDTLFDTNLSLPYPDLKQVSLEVGIAAWRTDGLAVDLALMLLVRSLRVLQTARDASNGDFKEMLDLNDKMSAIQYMAWKFFEVSRLSLQRYVGEKSRDVGITLPDSLTFPSAKEFNAYWDDITLLTTPEQGTSEGHGVESIARQFPVRRIASNVGDVVENPSKSLQNSAGYNSLASDGTISGSRSVKLDIENGAKHVQLDNFVIARRVHLEAIGGVRRIKLDAIDRSDAKEETQQPFSFWTTLDEAPPLDLTPRPERKGGTSVEAQEEKSGPYG